MCKERRRFSQKWLQNGKLMSRAWCHGVPCSLPSRITTWVLKNCKTFSPRPRPRPRPNVQDQGQDFMIHDQDQDFHFCPRGASRPRPWSRGLHPCFKVSVLEFYCLCNLVPCHLMTCVSTSNLRRRSLHYAVRGDLIVPSTSIDRESGFYEF